MNGEEFRQIRLRLGLTQREIADALGYKERTIRKFEANPLAKSYVRINTRAAAMVLALDAAHNEKGNEE